jgi:hypothetical protein
MKAILNLFNFLFIACIANAQSFPADFVGHWKGEMEWCRQGKKSSQKFPMQLRIQPADTAGQYTWQIIYGKEQTDNRPYILKPVDTAKGHWVVDERNGIILDQYWMGNKLSGVFSVGGSIIFNSYWLEKGKLMVEFVSIPTNPLARTGSGTEDSPYVDSYTIKSFQKGILSKVKPQHPLPLRKPK